MKIELEGSEKSFDSHGIITLNRLRISGSQKYTDNFIVHSTRKVTGGQVIWCQSHSHQGDRLGKV